MDERSVPPTDATAGPPPWFLLFGGTQREAIGGLRSLRGVFDSEEEGRAAFRRLRLGPRSAPGWGELVALEPSGRVRAVCWFGVPSQAVAVDVGESATVTEAPGTTTDVPGVSRRRRLRRQLAQPSAGAARAGIRAGGSR